MSAFHRYPPNEEAFHKALMNISGHCLTLTKRQRGYVMGAYRMVHPMPCPDEGCPYFNTGATCQPMPAGGCISTMAQDPVVPPAPCHYGPHTASAWQSGYAACAEKMQARIDVLEALVKQHGRR